jgi:tetratricopeptide (TPR) repeat protein
MRFNILSLLFFLICFNSFVKAQPESALYRDAQAAYKRGLEFYGQSLYGKAQDEFELALSGRNLLFPAQNTSELFFVKAELYAALSALKLEHPDAEKRLLSFIQKNEPGSDASRAKLEVGNYYYAKREYDKAIQYLSKITWTELGDMSNEEVLESKFKLAYCYFVKKQFQPAATLFQQIKGSPSKYAESAIYYYGLCAFFQKKYKEALDNFEKIDDIKKYQDVVPSYIVQIHFMLKDYDKTISYGEPLLKNDKIKDRQTISQYVGQAYYEKGNFKKALPFIEEYVEKTPKVTEDVFYQLAYTQYRCDRCEDAIANFEQINGLNSKLGQHALYNQANCQLKISKKKEARLSFEQASEKDFDKVMKEDALMNYAKLSYELGFDNDAISAFMKISPNSKYYVESQNLLSSIFLNTRDYDKALEILRSLKDKTQSLNITYQKVCYFRGVQYFNEGNHVKAIELFNEALNNTVHPETTALCYYWKAESLYLTDKTDACIKEYEKYMLAQNQVPQLPSNSSKGTAFYGLGYAHLKKGDYLNAAKNFEASAEFIKPKLKNINDKHVTGFVYPDAIIRTADCYLFLSSENREYYKKAGDFYQQIISNSYAGEDYAMYQLSLIYGLTGNQKKQLQLNDLLVDKYAQSPYSDDALYMKGSTQIGLNEFANAKITFDRLVANYPNSEFNKRAMYKLGVISFGKNNNKEALEYFKAVVGNNIQTDEAKDALVYIRKIYVESGDPDGFLAYAATIDGYNFSNVEADSLLFETAENVFDTENWASAADNYSKYLQRFPKGNNSMSAYHNRGICYYNLKKYEEAFEDFEAVADAKNPPAPPALAENSNLLAGRICFHVTKDYKKALKHYKAAEPLSSTADNRYESLLFGLRSAYLANEMQALGPLAENFLKETVSSAQDKAEAYFCLAKSQFAAKQYDNSKKNFEDAIKLVGDDMRASESRYRIAQIYYLQRNLEKSMDIAFQNNKQLGNHQDWLARNFILISDIYAEQGNLDAAKGTLESLLKNYDGDAEIIKEAKTKLENIKKAKSSNSRLKMNDESGELEMINGK